jgi:gas vesicle protein
MIDPQSGEQGSQESEQVSRSEPDGGGIGLGGLGAGILIGAVLGIGLGMLFAPERGDAMRKRLRKRLAKARARAGDELESAGKRTRKELARRRRRLEEALERVREGR